MEVANAKYRDQAALLPLIGTPTMVFLPRPEIQSLTT